MIGPYDQVQFAQFTPLTFDEMLKPAQVMRERHDQIDVAYGDINNEMSKVQAILDANPGNTNLQEKYAGYMNDLTVARDELMDRGVTRGSMRRLLDLKARYNTDAAPVAVAHQLRAEDNKAYMQRVAQDPTYLGNDPSLRSLEDYVNGGLQSLGFEGVSGAMLTKQAAAMATPLSKHFSAEFTRAMEHEPRLKGILYKHFKESGLTLPQYYNMIEKKGVPPEILADPELLASMPILRSIVDSVVESSGLNRLQLTPDQKMQALSYIQEGLWPSIGETSQKQLSNADYGEELFRGRKSGSGDTTGKAPYPLNINVRQVRSDNPMVAGSAIDMNRWSDDLINRAVALGVHSRHIDKKSIMEAAEKNARTAAGGDTPFDNMSEDWQDAYIARERYRIMATPKLFSEHINEKVRDAREAHHPYPVLRPEMFKLVRENGKTRLELQDDIYDIHSGYTSALEFLRDLGFTGPDGVELTDLDQLETGVRTSSGYPGAQGGYVQGEPLKISDFTTQERLNQLVENLNTRYHHFNPGDATLEDSIAASKRTMDFGIPIPIQKAQYAVVKLQKELDNTEDPQKRASLESRLRRAQQVASLATDPNAASQIAQLNKDHVLSGVFERTADNMTRYEVGSNGEGYYSTINPADLLDPIDTYFQHDKMGSMGSAMILASREGERKLAMQGVEQAFRSIPVKDPKTGIKEWDPTTGKTKGEDIPLSTLLYQFHYDSSNTFNDKFQNFIIMPNGALGLIIGKNNTESKIYIVENVGILGENVAAAYNGERDKLAGGKQFLGIIPRTYKNEQGVTVDSLTEYQKAQNPIQAGMTRFITRTTSGNKEESATIPDTRSAESQNLDAMAAAQRYLESLGQSTGQ
jgi:hypothetical protein